MQRRIVITYPQRLLKDCIPVNPIIPDLIPLVVLEFVMVIALLRIPGDRVKLEPSAMRITVFLSTTTYAVLQRGIFDIYNAVTTPVHFTQQDEATHCR